MFERFTTASRWVVVIATEAARDHADDRLGTEHLLIGLCDQDAASATGAVLTEHGVDRRTVLADLAGGAHTEQDREALASVGVDLDEVRGEIERSFGAGALDNTRAAGRTRKGRNFGHIPFTDDAKRALERTLRIAVDQPGRSIRPEHLLLALTELPQTKAAAILAAHGVNATVVRDAVDGSTPL